MTHCSITNRSVDALAGVEHSEFVLIGDVSRWALPDADGYTPCKLLERLDLPVSDPRREVPAVPPPDGSGAATGKPEWNRDIKAYYDAIASEPVPDEIQALMATLAKAIRK